MDLGPHAAFIIASYAVVAAVMIGLIAWLVLDGRRHRRALEALEAQGIRRRSRVEDARP
ncbi:MAG: heme exporter protein CcmD [Hyphomicrobiaceae bacterium]